jgi:hypothetical protein
MLPEFALDGKTITVSVTPAIRLQFTPEHALMLAVIARILCSAAADKHLSRDTPVWCHGN